MKVQKLVESLQIKKINENTVKSILQTVDINNSRYNAEQFKKLFNSNIIWVAAVENNKFCALAAIKEQPQGFYYLNEIQSFQTGSGSELLKELINNYHNFYLLVDPFADVKLLEYYKKFNLKEYKLNDSRWNKPIVFFYKTKNENELINYINSEYKSR